MNLAELSFDDIMMSEPAPVLKMVEKIEVAPLEKQDYFAIDALSYSKIKHMDNPIEFFEMFVEKSKEFKPTPSTVFGSALDLAMTEPEAYDKLIVKDCKSTGLEGHVTIIQKETISKMINRLRGFDAWINDDFIKSDGSYYKLGEILDHSTKQEELQFDFCGEKFKAKLDFLLPNGTIIDLKSTVAESIAEFKKQIEKMGYYIQAAIYCYAMSLKLGYMPDFYFIGISTKSKNKVFVIKCSEEMIQAGLIHATKLTEKYKDYRDNNRWLEYEPMEIMDLSTWKLKEIL